MCTYRCQLCASWSHGHSSYYVLHFYKLIFRNKSEEFPRRHFTFSFGKMRSNYFVALGAIGPQDKPLYNHNQKKSSSSSSSLSPQSREISFNNSSIFNWTIAFRRVGVALHWKMFKITKFDFSTALVQNKNWKLHLLVSSWLANVGGLAYWHKRFFSSWRLLSVIVTD